VFVVDGGQLYRWYDTAKTIVDSSYGERLAQITRSLHHFMALERRLGDCNARLGCNGERAVLSGSEVTASSI
jgi:hypothetical protein